MQKLEDTPAMADGGSGLPARRCSGAGETPVRGGKRRGGGGVLERRSPASEGHGVGRNLTGAGAARDGGDPTGERRRGPMAGL